MPFEPGKPRPINAGRKKGSLNKKTVEFLAILEKHNFNPGEELIFCYKEMVKLYAFQKKKKNIAGSIDTLEKAAGIANDVCQFVYPKKKAVEHTGEIGVKTFADFVASAELTNGEDESA